MNILARDQIHASDVYWRIILSQNCPKLDTLDKKAHCNTENTKTRLYRLTKIIKSSENSTNEIDSQKIYTSIALMSINEESYR